ncbi:MAG: O-antigen ligase family protein [Aquamicrobium sp.]|nr:O-antigen ligase family protein [Aquamicrobium sp.]
MKIAKALLVNPDRNFWYGAVAVAVSIFVFAYSTRFGQVSILAYYACWLPLVLVDYKRTLGDYRRFFWIIAFAVLACLSMFWSAAPGVTARAGVQLLSHVVCALIAARTVSVRTLNIGALGGILMVVLFSVAFGQYNLDPIDGTYSFVGAFSSKNQLGLFSSLGIYFAFTAVAVQHERGLWRLLAICCGLLCAYTLLAAQSATSVLAIGATLAMLISLKLAMLFSPSARKGGLVAGMAIGLLLIFVGLNMGAADAVLGAFGKDSTLTGRTYLWQQGWEAAMQSPWFGIGYQGYWVQGFSEAERLWQEFYIGSRSGFHFHNTYIEVLVELGLAGILAIAVLMVRVPFGLLLRLVDARQDPASFTLLGVAVMFLIRSFVEVDVINPYVVGSFLVYYAAGQLVLPQRVSHLATTTRLLRQGAA